MIQQRKERRFTTMHTASIAQPGTIFHNLHLPEEAAIGSAYIENATAANLTVYEGSSAGGRVIGKVAPTHYKRMAIADHISSLTITADSADPSPALVIVTLTTRLWAPVHGSLE